MTRSLITSMRRFGRRCSDAAFLWFVMDYSLTRAWKVAGDWL